MLTSVPYMKPIYHSALLLITLLITSSIALSQVEVKTTRETKLLDCQGIEFGRTVSMIPSGQTITLTDYYAGYFTVTYADKQGYVYYPFLIDIKGLDEFKQQGDERNKGLKIESCLLKQLQEKYGNADGLRAYSGQPWIGMKASIARDLLGSPKSINSTESQGRKQEQWVYDNEYLYFENGVLTTIQKHTYGY